MARRRRRRRDDDLERAAAERSHGGHRPVALLADRRPFPGHQDAAGRERLISAIQSVQNDFDRILVITHLDELRDAFPARIEVTKTAGGSQVRVV